MSASGKGRMARPGSWIAALAGGVFAVWGTTGMTETLAGSEWVPLEIDGAAASERTRAFVRFGGDGRLSGNSGCNRFTGSYEIDGATLRIGPDVAMTRMACPPEIMAEEARLMRALEAVRGFSRDGIALDLTAEDGMAVLRMRQTDWD